jgi:hypothetical protein
MGILMHAVHYPWKAQYIPYLLTGFSSPGFYVLAVLPVRFFII